MSRCSRIYKGLALSLLVLLAIPTPAYADNCGGLQDCYGTIAAALAVLAAIVVVALLVFLLWEALAVGAAMGEAAAVGLAEGAAEGIAELEAEASFAEWLAAEEAAAAEAAAAEAAAAETAAAEAVEAAAAEAAESNFATEELLAEHFEKHVLEQEEFAYESAEEYLEGAQDFFEQGVRGEGGSKNSSDRGEIRCSTIQVQMSLVS